LTVGDAILQSKADMNLLIKGITSLIEFAYKEDETPQARYAARVRGSIVAKRFQRKWEEVVTEIKDIIVLRTGSVLAGNELSNLSMLKLQGMSIADIATAKGRYLEALNVYRAQAEELNKLEWFLKTGTRANEHPQFRNRIGLLEESMNKNPAKKLIDAGFMPTIVEDVETDTQDYSYKGKLIDKIDAFTNKRGKAGKVAQVSANNLYMSESTTIHQFMKYATQVSDFTARGALYEHLVKEGKLTEQQILSKVSQSFINYSIASHRTLDVLNRLGLVMFTKFVLRIQKPLFEAMRDKPFEALQLMVLDQLFTGAEVITESAFTERAYSPFKSGALGYPGVLDDIATFNAATSTFSGLTSE
jgi:hypothetical protein